MTEDLDRLGTYDFELPAQLIAQEPAAERTGSRLLVLKRDAIGPEHKGFADLLELLVPGDLLVVNDTTVVPARLFGEKAGTGGKVECLLVRADGPQDGARFICLLNASKKPKPGARLIFEGEGIGDALIAEVEGAVGNEPGAYFVRFQGDVLAFARAYGHVPLPPYIARDTDGDEADAHSSDRLRYQTVYADPNKPGSSAAPTAGLHFDEALLKQLEQKGVRRASVTLHVGPGTFLPVRDDSLSAHVMHAEPWWVSEQTARAVSETKARGGRVVCVGTTSLRALESSVDADGVVRAGSGLTRLFIRPGAGAPVRSADALVTNFHLPKSTLLVLVCAFAGTERVQAAYRAAVDAQYRFFSYGDACFFERQQ